MAATIKRVPAFVKQISNAAPATGYDLAGFNFWPAASPIVAAERGEPLNLTLRVRPLAGGRLQLAPDAPSAYKLRYEPDSDTYWLEINFETIADTGMRLAPLIAAGADGSSKKLDVQLNINAPVENMIATPRQLDLGEVSLAGLKEPGLRAGRMGVRKLVGSFQITAVSSTLEFLKFDVQKIGRNTNYLITVSLDLSKLPKAGTHTGVVRIDTDDRHTPRIEEPVKISLVDR